MLRSSGNMIIVPAANPPASSASFVVKNGACVWACVLSRGLVVGGVWALICAVNAPKAKVEQMIGRLRMRGSHMVEAALINAGIGHSDQLGDISSRFFSELLCQTGLGS